MDGDTQIAWVTLTLNNDYSIGRDNEDAFITIIKPELAASLMSVAEDRLTNFVLFESRWRSPILSGYFVYSLFTVLFAVLLILKAHRIKCSTLIEPGIYVSLINMPWMFPLQWFVRCNGNLSNCSSSLTFYSSGEPLTTDVCFCRQQLCLNHKTKIRVLILLIVTSITCPMEEKFWVSNHGRCHELTWNQWQNSPFKQCQLLNARRPSWFLIV